MIRLRASALDLGLECPGYVGLAAHLRDQGHRFETPEMQRGTRLHVALALVCAGLAPPEGHVVTDEERAYAEGVRDWIRAECPEVGL